jgi:hypothetical protein
MAANNQLAKIHIAKKDLGLTDNDYRDLLSGFGVSSSKELSYNDAEELIKLLKKLGWDTKPPKKKKQLDKNKFTGLNKRPPHLATLSQLHKVEVMWHNASNQKDKSSLNKFIKRIAGVDNIEWLLKADVSKIIKAIENLK